MKHEQDLHNVRGEEELMDVMELASRIMDAAKTMGTAVGSPIQGWGLQPPTHNADWFHYVVLEEASGCRNSRCAHNSHDPAAPVAAWVPREGVRILGSVRGPRHRDDCVEAYYVAVRGDEVRFFRYVKAWGYWARVERVKVEDVPHYVLVRLFERFNSSQ